MKLNERKRGWLGLVGVCVMPLAVNAIELTTGSPYYLGNALPGRPASEVNETLIVQTLVDLAPGHVTFIRFNGTLNDVERSGNSFTDLPSPVEFVRQVDVSTTDPFYSFDLGSGYAYVLGKYGNGGTGFQISHVWYVGDLSGVIGIPGRALSHYTLFNPGTGVPDGGTTLVLLGLAIGALGLARRRFA